MPNNYGPKIVTDGLELFLDAANIKSYPGSGTNWANLMRNEKNGTLINGPTFNSEDRGSLVFDNTDDHVVIPQSSLVIGPQFTACFWAYIPRGGPGSGMMYFANAAGRIIDITILPYGASGARIWYDAGRDLSNNVNRMNPILDAGVIYNRWNYYAFTKNATTGFMGIYINSELISSATGANLSIIAPSSDGYIAYSPQFAVYFYGKLPVVKMYSRELSAKEIFQNYSATKGRFKL